MQTQKTLTRLVVKVAATEIDLRIRGLNPSNPVYQAHVNADRRTTMVAAFHQRTEITAGWVCGSGLRYLRKRTKVTTEAD